MAQKRTHYITIKTKTFVNQIVEILGDFVIASVTFRFRVGYLMFKGTRRSKCYHF